MTAPWDRVAGQLDPYAAPESAALPPAPPANAETLRRQHLRSENSLKLIGVCFLALAGIAALEWLPRPAAAWTRLQLDPAGRLADLAGMVVLPLAFGLSLVRLHPLARHLGTLTSVAAIYAMGGCAGSLFAAFFYSLVHVGQAKTILTDDYQQIRRATPDQDHWFWIVLACALASAAIFYFAIDAIDSIGSGPG